MASADGTSHEANAKYISRYRPLKINHHRARAEFAELIKLIPEAERWKSPFPPQAKNGWQSLHEAQSKHVALDSFFEGPDMVKHEAELDRVELAAEERIPWPQDKDWALLKRWLAANSQYENLVNEIIKESDYISEFENQELCYYEDPLGFYDAQTLRLTMLFLKQRVYCDVRAEQWDEVLKTLDIMRLLVKKMTGTKGYVFQAMIRMALVGVIRDTAIKVLYHPRVELKLGEAIWQFILTLRELQPQMESEHRLEYQNFYPNLVAQVPILKNIRDQIPALNLFGYIEKPGADVVFAPPQPVEPSKYDDILDPGRIQDSAAEMFGLSRALPALQGHPKPFDKAHTVTLGWEASMEFLAEYRRHEHPNLSMTWQPEKYYAELNRINAIDKEYEEKLNAAIQRGDTDLPVKPPLTDDIVAELRRVFAKQENPLGRLFMAATFSSASFIAYNSIPRERWEASELIAACWLFEKRHKSRPKVLGQLVDERLVEKIPISAHSGEAFGYDAKRGLLWRRGASGSADGRLPAEEVPHGPSEAEIARDYYPVLGIYPLIAIS